ncbi:hypothetical protein ID263_004671 [Escherichia coli]|uniref:hypothetical protein n=1 Tax=Escherichia coli TaxID=562 RepID=UPI0017CC8AE5|nr:hypothetical protein [Escherichia coli]EFE6858369.1 hypothetical protein [Escherichia coli]EFO0740857.1 hypothetical protein [Escherichia coli]EGH0606424.1 hypothetical protein [Escherichia coli]EHB0476290.1 hypothetical protein [Escherichia coli]
MTIDNISQNELYYQTIAYNRSRTRVSTAPDLQEKAVTASGHLIPPQIKNQKVPDDNTIQKKDWPELSSPTASARIEDIGNDLESILKIMKDDAPDLYDQMINNIPERVIDTYLKNQKS